MQSGFVLARRARDRSRCWLGRLSLTLASAALTLGASELVARSVSGGRDARLWDTDTSRLPSDADPDKLRLIDIIRAAPYADLVYELRPGVKGRFRLEPYRSNSHGMRDVDFTLEKPPGEFRVASLGNSICFGWGIRAGESYSTQLQSHLRATLPGRPVRVMNFGVPGYNTATEAACLHRKALAFQPDLVVLQYYHNDTMIPNFLTRAPPPPRSYLWSWIQRRSGRGQSLAARGESHSGRPRSLAAELCVARSSEYSQYDCGLAP